MEELPRKESEPLLNEMHTASLIHRETLFIFYLLISPLNSFACSFDKKQKFLAHSLIIVSHREIIIIIKRRELLYFFFKKQ